MSLARAGAALALAMLLAGCAAAPATRIATSEGPCAAGRVLSCKQVGPSREHQVCSCLAPSDVEQRLGGLIAR